MYYKLQKKRLREQEAVSRPMYTSVTRQQQERQEQTSKTAPRVGLLLDWFHLCNKHNESEERSCKQSSVAQSKATV